MAIEFTDFDLFEFFVCEPVYIGDKEAAISIYSIKDDQMFSLTLTVDTYAQTINISVMYQQYIVFSGEFEGVTAIRKGKDYLLVELQEYKRLVIKKSPLPSVSIETYNYA